jgi:hypothetical protein
MESSGVASLMRAISWSAYPPRLEKWRKGGFLRQLGRHGELIQYPLVVILHQGGVIVKRKDSFSFRFPIF